MRAGASTTQGRIGPRSLRGPLLDRSPPTRPYDDDRLCLPAIPPPQRSGRGEKESSARRLNQAFPLSGWPSSPPSHSHRQFGVRIAQKHSDLKICQSSARASQRLSVNLRIAAIGSAPEKSIAIKVQARDRASGG